MKNIRYAVLLLISMGIIPQGQAASNDSSESQTHHETDDTQAFLSKYEQELNEFEGLLPILDQQEIRNEDIQKIIKVLTNIASMPTKLMKISLKKKVEGSVDQKEKFQALMNRADTLRGECIKKSEANAAVGEKVRSMYSERIKSIKSDERLLELMMDAVIMKLSGEEGLSKLKKTSERNRPARLRREEPKVEMREPQEAS